MWRGNIRFLEKTLAETIGFSFEREAPCAPGFEAKRNFENCVLSEEAYTLLLSLRENETDAYWTLEKELDSFEGAKTGEKIAARKSWEREFEILRVAGVFLVESLENEWAPSPFRRVEIRCETENRKERIAEIRLGEYGPEEYSDVIVSAAGAKEKIAKWESVLRSLS